MNTIYEKVDVNNIDASVIERAGSIIRDGGLVAFPTETVYGLGGDAFSKESARKIYEAKGRPSDNPLIVHIARTEDLEVIAKSIPPAALILSQRYWPGPLTMIFQKKDIVPKETTGGLDTVAVRFPYHPVAKALIEASGGFIAAPSANISGRPSPTNGRHVREDMDGRIEMIIDSGSCDIGLESTIIDMTVDPPMMLRPGYVNEAMLKSAVGEVSKDPAVFCETATDAQPKAPGMRYRHYAPKGKLSIVTGDNSAVIRFIKEKTENKDPGKRIAVLTCSAHTKEFAKADLICDAGSRDDEIGIASKLFDMLRRCDEEAIDEIYSEEFDTPDLGLAIMNRLIRAAGHNIINV